MPGGYRGKWGIMRDSGAAGAVVAVSTAGAAVTLAASGREGRLWAAVVDWLAGAGVGEAAAVDMAELLDSVSGQPIIAVRGPAGIGAGAVAEALRGHPVARGHWAVVADEGPAPRIDADAVITLAHDPGAVARPGEVVADPRALRGRGFPLDDAAGDPGPAIDPISAVAPDSRVDALIGEVEKLTAPEVLADVRAGRLERGVAAIAAAHPIVRDELEDLLWP
ncbi:hypothetical protein CHAN_13150 [Corynebacterium hansenii]|nr:hypothetical protein CHAN_13150 [Corynebacterium hansenii]